MGLLSQEQCLNFSELLLCFTLIWPETGRADFFSELIYIRRNLPSADVPTEPLGLGCPPWL